MNMGNPRLFQHKAPQKNGCPSYCRNERSLDSLNYNATTVGLHTLWRAWADDEARGRHRDLGAGKWELHRSQWRQIAVGPEKHRNVAGMWAMMLEGLGTRSGIAMHCRRGHLGTWSCRCSAREPPHRGTRGTPRSRCPGAPRSNSLSVWPTTRWWPILWEGTGEKVSDALVGRDCRCVGCAWTHKFTIQGAITEANVHRCIGQNAVVAFKQWAEPIRCKAWRAKGRPTALMGWLFSQKNDV